MSERYILDGHTAKEEPDLIKWAKWLETADRHVAQEKIGNAKVSTVFLGLDHSFGGGIPILFETMVFGGKLDQEQERYATWEEAKKGHKRMVERVREEIK